LGPGIRDSGHSQRTRTAADVIEGQLGDAGVELEKERQRLADATGGTEDGDLGELGREFVSAC